MAYTAWSVVFGEQPTAAKWNQLGTNDAGFKDGTNFDNDIIKSKHMDWAATGGGDNGGIWWEELGRHTLASGADVMTVSGFAARKYLLVLVAVFQTGGTISGNMTFNNDTGNNYSDRNSTDGAADATQTSVAAIFGTNTATAQTDKFSVHEIVNIANKEKLVISRVTASQAGAANAPNKRENAGKWANTSAQITRIDITNSGTGDFAAGSEIVVLGHD